MGSVAAPSAMSATAVAGFGTAPEAATASAMRSRPIAKPMPGTGALPSDSTSPSYLPPATTVLCAPTDNETTSKVVRDSSPGLARGGG